MQECGVQAKQKTPGKIFLVTLQKPRMVKSQLLDSPFNKALPLQAHWQKQINCILLISREEESK